MAFELPLAGSGLPTEQGVPYIGAKDNANRIAVGAGMYWKNASGVWVPVSETDPVPAKLTGSNIQDEQAIPVRRRAITTVPISNISVGAGASVIVISKTYQTTSVPDQISAFVYGDTAHQFNFKLTFVDDTGYSFSDHVSSAGTSGNRQIINRTNVQTRRINLMIVNNDITSHTYNGTIYEWTR